MLNKQRRKLIIPLLLPAVVLYSIFFTYPALQAVPFAFQEWSGLTPSGTFNGIENFRLLFAEEWWWNALFNTVKFMVISGLVVFPLGLLFGVVLNSTIPFRRFFKFIIFAPSLLSAVAVAMLISLVYNPRVGMLNALLELVGLGQFKRAWLGDMATALPTLAVSGVWAGLGFMVILLLAGLQKIPPDLYDAARVDGAGGWAVFRHITFPLLWEVFRLLLILHIIGGLQTFALVLITTRGGPGGGGGTYGGGATDVVGLYIYRTAFIEYKFGYATAVALIMLIMVMGATVLTSRATARETVEY